MRRGYGDVSAPSLAAFRDLMFKLRIFVLLEAIQFNYTKQNHGPLFLLAGITVAFQLL